MYKVNEQRMAEWALQVQDWHDSGLSQKAWCQVHGISVNTFCKRIRKLKEYSSESKALCVQKTESTFAEVTSIAPVSIPGNECKTANTNAIVVEIGKSIIRIFSEAKINQIKTVLQVMKNA